MPDSRPPAPPGVPTLVAVAHGTRDPAGIAAIRALLDRVRALRPGLAVREAYLEVAEPSLPDALGRIAEPVVVVPLLLAVGYHAAVDIPRMIAARAGRAGERAWVADVLGPHPLLVEALVDRLREAGWRPGDAVVLGAAGSSDPGAAAATESQAALLADAVGAPVTAAYASAALPTVPHGVATLRRSGADRVAIASYLLAPGDFQSRLTAAGADLVADPLADHAAVARLVLARYDDVRASFT